MKKQIGFFLQAVLAGLSIAMGGTIYLSLENKIVGALLFTVGLYIIVLNGLYLYTGKIGYLVGEKPGYLVTLLVTWLGNLLGTFLGAKALLCTRVSNLSEAAAAASQAKLNQTVWSALILSFFCGILMYVAVDGFREKQNPLILFLCVSVFILCGFEHCVANMFYFSLGDAWSLKAFGYLIIMTLGNSLGGMLIPAARKCL